MQGVESLSGLIELIESLDENKESLLLTENIIPDTKITRKLKEEKGLKQEAISHYNLKYGPAIKLKTPKTLERSRQDRRSIRDYLKQEFKKLEKQPQSEIFYMGYSFYPIIKGNQKTRRIPLDHIFQACQRLAYDEGLKNKINITSYNVRKKSRINGAQFLCEISSVEKGVRGKTKLKLNHVPVVNNQYKREIIYSIEAEFLEQPGDRFNEVNLSGTDPFTKQRIRESMTFYPQEIEAYLAVVKSSYEENNKVPWQVCPFFLPSKRLVNIWRKLNNNILIYDKTLTETNNPQKLRRLHVAEKCFVEANFFPKKTGLGYNECVYQRKRDGKLEDFNWSFKTR